MRFLKWVLLLAVAAVPAFSTVLQKLSVDEMARVSSAVVHGRIVGARSEWNQAPRNIVTVYTVEAFRYLKGGHGRTFEIRQMGGTVGGLSQSVAGSPHFRVGDEVVLFLWTSPDDGHREAVGFEQGVFRVRSDAAGKKLLNRAAPLAKDRGARTSLDLDRFLTEIAAEVR
jgi:hypothetical protein